MLTNLSTLLAEGELERLGEGTCAAVVAISGWRAKCKKLQPETDVNRAMRHALLLTDLAFDLATRSNWCSRLQGRPGLFEIRVNGVRFYGGRVGNVASGSQEILLLVFAGAEQKAGRRAASDDELDRAESAIAKVRAQLETSNVVAIGAARSKRK